MRNWFSHLISLYCLAVVLQPVAKELNVLLIAVDDLRPELGCYNVNYAQTPNMDRLAGRGMLFLNHFVQVPTCGASRYALLTGRSPANTGVTSSNHVFHGGPTPLSSMDLAGAQSLPELFRRSDYHTILIGKISHTADGRVYAYNGTGDGRDEVPNSWLEMSTPYGNWKRGWGIFFAYADGYHREDGNGHRNLTDFTVEDDEALPDGLMASHAIRRLRHLSRGDSPFFMGLGFFKPHLPFVAPKQDWEAFKDADIPPPEHPDKPASMHWHRSNEFFKYKFPYPKGPPLLPTNAINARRAYLACVRYVDRQIGRVLDTLMETGLANSTLVVLWGDHGWNLGDSQMWGKHTPFERAVRSPLIISMPGMKNPGHKSDALVETIDIFPTLLDLAKPRFNHSQHSLDGRSLSGLLENPDGKVKDASLSFWRNAISVRSRSHRLIVTRDDGRITNMELYDASTSFDPVNNLAASHPDVVRKLLAHLPPEK